MISTAHLLTLRVDLRDEAACARIRPEALTAYVERAGFALKIDTGVCRYYYRDDTEIVVPQRTDFRDYGRRVLSAINALAGIEDRSALAVYVDMQPESD